MTPCALIYFAKMVCCTTIKTGLLTNEVKIFKLYPFFFSSDEAEDIFRHLPAMCNPTQAVIYDDEDDKSCSATIYLV